MCLIDEQPLNAPFHGRPWMTASLKREGYAVNHKRVQRLMRITHLPATRPKRKADVAGPGHKITPYLLYNLDVTHSHQIWSANIAYVPMPHGVTHLVVILD